RVSSRDEARRRRRKSEVPESWAGVPGPLPSGLQAIRVHVCEGTPAQAHGAPYATAAGITAARSAVAATAPRPAGPLPRDDLSARGDRLRRHLVGQDSDERLDRSDQ